MSYNNEKWVNDLPQKPGEKFDVGWHYPYGLGICPIHLVMVRKLPDEWCIYAIPKYLPPEYAHIDPKNRNTVRDYGWKIPEKDARRMFPQMAGVAYSV